MTEPPTRRPRRAWVPGQRLVGPGDLDLDALPANAPDVGVLAVQGDVLEHLRVLVRLGARPRRVRASADLDGLDGLVVPGGESTTIGTLLERFALLEPLRGRVRDGLPVLGTCAGLILLSDRLDQVRAQPLVGGIDVTTRRNAFGNQLASFEADLDVRDVTDDGPPMRAVFIRAPWVTRVGPGVDVLAEVDGHPVVVRQGQLWGAAFHPELSGDDRLHAAFLRVATR